MWSVGSDEIIQSIQSIVQVFLPLPLWIEHAAVAFVIICATMLFRRSTVCRLAVAVALLVSGAMLLDLLPQPTMAGVMLLPAQLQAASIRSLVMDQRQFAEIALLSLGSAWILDEFKALLARRRLARVDAKKR
jgi:hypothetical protein